MANYSELLNDINAAIYENNDQEIDALEVRAILREMVTSLGSGFLFKGIATPSSPSGTGTYEPDQNVFYLATTAGTYTYLGGLVVAAGEVAFLCFDGSWTKKSSALLSTGSIVDNTTTDDATKPLSAKQGKVLADAGAATAAEVSALGHKVSKYGQTNTLVCPAAGSTIFDHPVYAGVKYTFSNAGPSQVNVVSRNGSSDVETLKLQLNSGESVVVVPTLDAPQVRIYAATGAATVTMSGGAFDDLSARVAVNENDIETIFTEPKAVTQEPGYYYNASGTKTAGANFNSFEISDLTGMRKIKFLAGVSSSAYYGFVVGGSFVKKSYTGAGNYGYVTMDVPAGATAFKCSWSTQWFANNDVTIVSSTAIADLRDQVDDIVSADALETALSDTFRMNIATATGGLLLVDGSFDSNTTYMHAEVDLTGKIIKTISFTETLMGSGKANYGFVINGAWYGYTPGVSVATPATINVPAGATAFKVCWNRNQINDNDCVLDAFGFEGLEQLENAGANKAIYQFTPNFDLSEVPTMTSPTSAQVSALTLSDLYGWYDALVTAYPNYVTKVDCDAGAQAALGITAPAELSGLPIYMYKFSPKIGGNGSGVDQTSRVKLLVTSMHPQERFGLYAMKEMMTMICANWATIHDAEQMRSLIDIYVLPCPWPWNFTNNSRVNYNGVNGNRQFPTTTWTESGQGTENWSGSAPLSEYEAKVINYHLLQIAPDACLDVHTSGNDNVGHMGILLVNQYDTPLVDLCGVIARTTSNAAIKDNANFPQSDPDKCIYGVYPENATSLGEFYEYAYEQGCKHSVLSEESYYSKWSGGTFYPSGSIIEQYTDGILREQVQWLFNIALRLVRGACVQFYE